MKRILLPILFSAAMVSAQAQQLQKPETMKFNGQNTFQKYDQRFDMQQAAPKANWKAAPRKAKSDGVYYTKPEQSLWFGSSVDGGYYYASLLMLAPYADVTFYNKSADKAGSQWTWRDEAIPAEENGDLYFGGLGCYQTNGYNVYGDAPILTIGNTSYTLGDMNTAWYEATKPQGNGGFQMQVDSLGDYAFIDYNHALSSGAWGIISPDENTSYLLGNGYVNTTDQEGNITGQYQVAGVSQIFPNPKGLYVNSVHSVVYTMTQPLTDGAKLTMTFYNVEEQDGEEVIGDRVLGEMFATVDTQTLLGGPYSTQFTSSGSVNIYSITFINESIDDFGGATVTPVVLNEKFAVVITGFDQPGVDVNFLGSVPQDEEDFEGQTDILVWRDAEKSGLGSFSYQKQIVIDLNFESMYDHSEILATGYDQEGNEYPNLNVVNVSADGQECTNDNGGVIVAYTAYPWLDDQDIENYYFELPDWISVMAFQEFTPQVSQGIEFRDGRVMLQPVCDALPEGVSGRYAVINLEGRGSVSSAPIIVLQGDATLDDVIEAGIKTVNTTKRTAAASTYNMAGQPVSDSFKGLVIKDGKKVMVK